MVKRSEKRKKKMPTAQEMSTTTLLGLFFFSHFIMLVMWQFHVLSKIVLIKKIK